MCASSTPGSLLHEMCWYYDGVLIESVQLHVLPDQNHTSPFSGKMLCCGMVSERVCGVQDVWLGACACLWVHSMREGKEMCARVLGGVGATREN
jgi:hypothetical protein